MLHSAVLWLTPECLQQVISCNPLHLSRKPMLRKVKGHKVDKWDSDPLKAVPDFGIRFHYGSSFLTGKTYPWGCLGGEGWRREVRSAFCLLFVLGSGEHFRGQGESHPPKVQNHIAFLEASRLQTWFSLP